MTIAQHSEPQHRLFLGAAAFALAAAAFWATMLTAPPISEASVGAPASRTGAVTICETLPSGDIANCTIQN